MAGAAHLAAQEGATVAVDPAEQTIAAGSGPFEVRVLVDDVTNAQGLGGYTLVLRYDPDVVEARAASDAGFVGTTENAAICPSSGVDNDEGVAALFCFTLPIFAEPGPTTTEPEVLARLTFEPVGAGTSVLDLSDTTPIDPQGGPIAVMARNGSVTVSGGSTPAAGAGATSTPEAGLPPSGEGPDGGSDAAPLYIGLVAAGVVLLAVLGAFGLARRGKNPA